MIKASNNPFSCEPAITVDSVDNEIISSAGFSLVGQNLTLNAEWHWRIDLNLFTNPADVVINIPFASSGKQRIDRIVATVNNTFIRIYGTESISNPVAPEIPNDTVEVTFFTVTDGVISEPILPIIGALFVEKSYYTPLVVSGTGIIDTENLDIKNSALKIQGTVTEIKSIQKNSSSFYIIGQPFFLYNETATPLKIPHLAGSGNIKFFNPEASDYFADPNEVVMFVLENVGGNLRYKRSTTRLQKKSVTLDKIQDIASGSILGRLSAGDGQPESLDWIDVLFLLGLETIEMDVASKQTKPIIISANKTAVVNEVYNNTGNNIYTDPTSPAPVNGNIYTVNNISGTATIGGVVYTSGIVQRSFDGTIWHSNNIGKKKGLVWSHDIIVNLTLTGTTAITYIGTVEFPKINLEGNGSVVFEIHTDKSATAAMSRLQTSLNATDSPTGEVIFAITETNATTTGRNPSIQRTIIFNPTTIQHSVTIAASTDFSSAGSFRHQVTSLPLKDNNFLRIYIENGSVGVTTTILGITAKIYNND